jgi:aspartate kinase
LCVIDDKADKIEKLAFNASAFANVVVQKNLSLLTIRHYNQATFEKLTKEKTILLRQQTPETLQVLLT